MTSKYEVIVDAEGDRWLWRIPRLGPVVGTSPRLTDVQIAAEVAIENYLFLVAQEQGAEPEPERLNFSVEVIMARPDKGPIASDAEEAVLCDIDGTLAERGERGPYEWAKVGVDKPIPFVVELLKALDARGKRIILLSGRDEVCREETKAWLDHHRVPFDMLLMRETGSVVGDDIMKLRLFDEVIRGQLKVIGVLDDRDRVVMLWRKLGLTCLQADYGDF